MFCKKDVFRNFAKFTVKHLCQSVFFNNVTGLRPETLLKKRLWHRCFPVNFAKFLKTSFLTEHLWWLLLSVSDFDYQIQWRNNLTMAFVITFVQINTCILLCFYLFLLVWSSFNHVDSTYYLFYCERLLPKFLFFKSQMIYFIRCKADVYLAMSLITKSECLKGIFLPLRSWMKCVKIWHGWNFLVMQSTFPWNIASNTLIFTSFPICHIYHYVKYVRIRVFFDPYNPVYRKI